MYGNLEAELSRKKITRQMLASYLNVALSTISQKLTGKSEMSIRMAVEIKKILKVDIPIEILFLDTTDSEKSA